jgi:hypothetical protein
MTVQFLDPATLELYEAVDFYNSECGGLGYEFAAEVKSAIGRIIQYPEAWTPLSKRTRRCRTNRFPYGVVYQQRDDTILNCRGHAPQWTPALLEGSSEA